MDIDPLGESLPPRHAIESDDEEDEYNPLSSRATSTVTDLNIVIAPDGLPSKVNVPLIIASGDAGRVWARGADLGEQTGTVQLNHVQVGLSFSPDWMDGNVMVSEAMTSLPVWAMHPYAEAVLAKFNPSSVVILDSYAAPAYISPTPVTSLNHPIRYLSTSGAPAATAEPFSPPNLIQCTSASFLSILARSPAISTILYLLPSSHIPAPPPKSLLPADASILSRPSDWDAETLESAHLLLLAAVGASHTVWKNDSGDVIPNEGAGRRRGDIGDGGMYI